MKATFKMFSLCVYHPDKNDPEITGIMNATKPQPQLIFNFTANLYLSEEISFVNFVLCVCQIIKSVFIDSNEYRLQVHVPLIKVRRRYVMSIRSKVARTPPSSSPRNSQMKQERARSGGRLCS